MKRPRRNHSPAFKARMALEALTGEQTFGAVESCGAHRRPRDGAAHPFQFRALVGSGDHTRVE